MARSSTLRSVIFPSQINVRTLILYNLIQGLYIGYIQVFWQPFLLTLGISIGAIGILEAAAGRNGFVASLVPSLGGHFSDRIGRKKIILLGSAFLMACWTVAALAFLIRASTLIVAVYVLWAIGGMSLPVLDATIADSVKTSERSRIYGVVLVASYLPQSVTGYLAGELSGSVGPTTLLGIAALLETIGFVLILKRMSAVPTAPVLRERFSFRDIYLNIKDHWKIFVVFVADPFAWTLAGTLLFALLQKVEGFTNPQLGLIALAMPLGVILGTLPSGILIHRVGAKTLLITSEVLGAILWVSFAVFPLPYLAPVYGFVWGFAISTWIPVQFQLTTQIFPVGNRGELLGNLATVSGLIRSLAPLLAAALFLDFGYAAPFYAGAAGILLTIIAILKFVPNSAELEQAIP